MRRCSSRGSCEPISSTLTTLFSRQTSVLIDVLVRSMMTRPSPFGPRLKSILVTPLASGATRGWVCVMLAVPALPVAVVVPADAADAVCSTVAGITLPSPPDRVRVTWLPLTLVL